MIALSSAPTLLTHTPPRTHLRVASTSRRFRSVAFHPCFPIPSSPGLSRRAMTRKVVIAVDGDTPQAVALLEWSARNLALCAKAAPADADNVNTLPHEAQVTILFASLPAELPNWGPYPLQATDKLWKGECWRERWGSSGSLLISALRPRCLEFSENGRPG